MQNIWILNQLSSEQEKQRDELMQSLRISRAVASMLVQRGITTDRQATDFLYPDISQLHDPFLMTDMQKAVERLDAAIRSKERILIYGDYDVDGTTSVALVYRYLRLFDLELEYYIPDRYTEGYGISYQGIDYANENGCSLIIALDCGIKAVEKIDYANSLGIDFIICDHHMPGDSIPKAIAVLDPKRSDCHYPYDELSGCGVGFKFVQAYTIYRNLDKRPLNDLLELLAMSIASDVVPLTGENRVLAYYGLKRINSAPSIGLKSILKVAGIEGQNITISDLVYKVGPRINASGRMKSGAEAVELLITQDPDTAEQKSLTINEYNEQRRGLDKQTTDEALRILSEEADNAERMSTVVFSRGWNKGVVGIVASRLTETYFRPTIVLTDSDDGYISGSARSVGGFDIYSAIDSCSDLLSNFGGHVFAAGLSMKAENLDTFKQRFEEYVRQHIRAEQQCRIIHAEAELRFSDINKELYETICRMEPFGPDNPVPQFITNGVVNNRASRLVGKEEEHLKLEVTDGSGEMSGIAFGFGKGRDHDDLAKQVLSGKHVDLCYKLENNSFRGREKLQLMVVDIRESQTD